MWKILANTMVLLCSSGMVIAQPMNPHTRAAIQTEMDRQARERRATRQQQNTGPSAAEVRAWHARERAVQERIARYRATPFYMAIAYDFSNYRISGDGGYYSERRAVEEALRRCRSSNCQLVTTFANSCAVVVEPDTRAKSLQDLFVATDVDDRKAAVKAMRDCEAKHGNNQCSYWEIPTRTGKFCTGYDYGVYGQK